MFTIRYEAHDDEGGYTTHSCDHYRVFPDSGNTSGIVVYMMYDPDAGIPGKTEYIGLGMPYAVAYVTNEQGRTIDTIREKPRPTISEAPSSSPPK